MKAPRKPEPATGLEGWAEVMIGCLAHGQAIYCLFFIVFTLLGALGSGLAVTSRWIHHSGPILTLRQAAGSVPAGLVSALILGGLVLGGLVLVNGVLVLVVRLAPRFRRFVRLLPQSSNNRLLGDRDDEFF